MARLRFLRFNSAIFSLMAKTSYYLWLLSFSAISYAQHNLAELPIGETLGQSLDYYIDQEKSLTIDQILNPGASSAELPWQRSQLAVPNFGISSNTYWYRLKLINNEEKTVKRIVEVANSRISSLELFQVSWYAGIPQVIDHYKTGLTVAFNDRERPTRNLTYKLSLEPGEHIDLYFKTSNVFGNYFPLYIWTEDKYTSAEIHRTAFQGLYFGTISALIIYNLFVFLMVRESSYIWYGVFMLTVSFFMFIDKGYAYQYLWPNSAYLEERIYSFTFSMTAITGVLFAISFLKLKKNLPFYYRLHVYMAIWWLLVIPLNFIIDFKWIIIIAFVSVFPSTTISFLAAVAATRKGDWGAKYYTASWLVLTGGSFYYTTAVSGLAHINTFSIYCFQVANIGEALLLSIGLAYRIKLLHLEKARARASEKAKSEFLANMSHEIRTPMNGVVGMAQLLQSTPMNSQQQNYLKVVVDSGNALLNILNDILDYSKIESGKMEIEEIEFSVSDLLISTSSIFSLQAKNSSLRYHLWISPNIPDKIVGDPNRLRQVITNFLSNAFKFTSRGYILLRCEYHEKNGSDTLSITIQDTGIGIKPEYLNNLFKGFSQADASISRRFGGTGLGLTISKTLIELMSGKVNVESEEGKGSRFWFEIPIINTGNVSLQSNNSELDKQIRDKVISLISNDPILQDSFLEFQAALGFKYSNSASLDSFLKKSTSDLHSVDEIVIDLLGNDALEEQFIKNLINSLDQKAKSITLLVPPGFSLTIDSHSDSIRYFEAPNCINGYFDQLRNLRSTQTTQTKQLIDNFSHVSTLVIEDNKVNQMVAKGLLSKLGITAHFASSAEEGIEWLQHNKNPNLILMDCSLPGIDGYEATRIIRKKHGDTITIVALSANALQDHRNLCVECGMNDQLSKPLKLEELERVLSQHFPLNGSESPSSLFLNNAN